MSEERPKEPLKRAPYEAPQVVRVSLRPEEAVLGNCKTAVSAGPGNSTCAALSCRTPGS